MEISVLLLRLRKERRLSQAEVAGQIGVSQSAYCSWESDRAVPKVRYYGPLAAVFGVDLQQLFIASQTDELPVPATPEKRADDAPAEWQNLLITAQEETIRLQKLRMERLEGENQQLRQQLFQASKQASKRRLT